MLYSLFGNLLSSTEVRLHSRPIQVVKDYTTDNYVDNIYKNAFTDPSKRFILFYPPDLELKGRENFLSSVEP